MQQPPSVAEVPRFENRGCNCAGCRSRSAPPVICGATPATTYAGLPASIQRRKTATRSAGHAPSHGIVPASRRCRMASACVETSSRDQRSKLKRIESRSRSRNRGALRRKARDPAARRMARPGLEPRTPRFSGHENARRGCCPGSAVASGDRDRGLWENAGWAGRSTTDGLRARDFQWPPLRLARLCREHESVCVVCPPELPHRRWRGGRPC
jgi:hypothetical protein